MLPLAVETLYICTESVITADIDMSHYAYMYMWSDTSVGACNPSTADM